MSCRRHDDWHPPRFEGDPRSCAFPSGWGRRAQQPEPPRRPWWGALIGVLFVLGVSMFVFVAVRGLLR